MQLTQVKLAAQIRRTFDIICNVYKSNKNTKKLYEKSKRVELIKNFMIFLMWRNNSCGMPPHAITVITSVLFLRLKTFKD